MSQLLRNIIPGSVERIFYSKSNSLSTGSFLATIFLLLAFSSVTGQSNTDLINKLTAITDSLKKINSTILAPQLSGDTTGVMSRQVYNRYLDERFTYLSYERGTLPTGNSASLDLLENETQIKLGLAKKFSNNSTKSILLATVGAQAKLDDGIAQLFNGNTATSGTVLFVNFAFLPKSIHFRTVTDQLSNGVHHKTPFGKIADKLKDYKNKFDDEYLIEFRSKYQNLLCRLQQIRVQLRDTLNNTCIVQASLLKEKDEIEKKLNDLGLEENDADDIVESIIKKYQQDYYDLNTSKPAWDWFTLIWLNAGLTYNRQSYTTYDSTLGLSKRFGSKNFDSWGLKFTLNSFKEKFQAKGIIRYWYANLSYEPKLISSYSDLKGQDIIKNIRRNGSVVDTNFVFQTNKKALDISKIPFATSWQHNFSGTYTAIFSKDKNFGINLLAQVQFSKISKPIYNTRVGFLISMKNNNFDAKDAKSKSKVNFELFIQFADMTDISNTGKSIWENRVIGISANIPFNQIFLK